TSPGGRRPLTTRFHPPRASARATPRPMPRVPPVTSATGRSRPDLASVRSARCSEEREVGIARGETLHVQRRLAQVIVAPLARLAARNVRAGGDGVPAGRPVIHPIEQQDP